MTKLVPETADLRAAILSLLAAASSLIAVAGLRSIELYGQWHGLSPATYWYVACWYGALSLGLLLPWRRSKFLADLTYGTRALGSDRLVQSLSLVAIFGALLLMYEFSYRRGYGFNTSIDDIRNFEINNAGRGFTGSWFGALGRLMTSALVVVAIAVFRHVWSVSWKSLFIAAIAAAAVFYEQSTFEGGRIFFSALLLMAISSSLFSINLIGLNKSIFSYKIRYIWIVLVAALLIIGTFWYNIQIFGNRVEYTIATNEKYAREAAASIESGKVDDRGRKRGVAPVEVSKNTYLEIYVKHAGAFALDRDVMLERKDFDITDYQIAMIWLYLTQGFNELDRLILKEDLQHAWGFYQFPQVAQIVSKFAGSDRRYNLEENLPVVGTYNTLPGAAYLDFGWIGGVLFALLIGIALRISIRGIIARCPTVLGLAAPILFTIVLCAPVFSLFPNFWPAFLWIALLCLLSLWRRISVRQTGSA